MAKACFLFILIFIWGYLFIEVQFLLLNTDVKKINGVKTMFLNGDKNLKKKHQRRLEDQMGPSHSTISIDAKLEGTLNGKNSIKIAGLVEGNVMSEMLVWIEKGGRVKGSVEAPGVIVEGEVNGNIDSKEKVEIRSGARIIGDISCKKLSVATDSFFDGKIKMDESQEQPYTYVDKRKNNELNHAPRWDNHPRLKI